MFNRNLTWRYDSVTNVDGNSIKMYHIKFYKLEGIKYGGTYESRNFRKSKNKLINKIKDKYLL